VSENSIGTSAMVTNKICVDDILLLEWRVLSNGSLRDRFEGQGFSRAKGCEDGDLGQRS
jgi:hypothetical protein